MTNQLFDNVTMWQCNNLTMGNIKLNIGLSTLQ